MIVFALFLEICIWHKFEGSGAKGNMSANDTKWNGDKISINHIEEKEK